MNVNKHDCIKKYICHFLIGDLYQYTLTYIVVVGYFFFNPFYYYYFFIIDVVVSTLCV